MKILAVDNSIQAPGFIEGTLDENYNIVKTRTLSFCNTNRKKYEVKTDDLTIEYVKQKDFKNKQFEKIMYYIEKFKGWKGDNIYHYAAIEDFAYSAKGKIASIAESTGNIKNILFNDLTKIRIYGIKEIKKFYTINGNSDKIGMEDYFDNDQSSYKPDISFLPHVYENKNGNPKDNIVDAFGIIEFLKTELKLRFGKMTLDELNPKQIEVFNKLHKITKDGLLTRDFIQKTF